MPELPEVETIKNELLETVIGKEIASVKIRLPKILKVDESVEASKNELDNPAILFTKILTNAKIKNVRRRAKLIIIELSNNYSIVVHLKLTGRLLYNIIPDPHTHFIFEFKDSSRLLFNDLRQFGYLKLIKNEQIKNLFLKENFGPEPLENDFTLEMFKNILAKKKRSRIKIFLLDQKNIAGIGNIYANEICFKAKVDPARVIGALSDQEIEKIFLAIKEILALAIKYKGTSTDAYRNIFGQKGNFVPFLKVYGRQKKKCLRKGCEGVIERINLGNRGTFFCPKCQR